MVTTDCTSGQGEILDNGKYERLSPINDAKKLFYNILEALENSMDSAILQTIAGMLRESVIVKEYFTVLV